MYVQVEGMSYTGKTTHAKRLTDRLRNEGLATVYRKSSCSERNVTNFLLQMTDKLPPLIGQLLSENIFALDLILDNFLIGKNLDRDISVVQDRGLVSFLTYNQYNFPEMKTVLLDYLKKSPLLQPSHTIYLFADNEDRIERLRARFGGNVPKHDNDEIFTKSGAEQLSMKEELLKGRPNLLRISTSEGSIDDVANEIFKWVYNDVK